MARTSKDWYTPMIDALRLSGAPVGVRTHGSPKNAPSVAPGPHGSYCFRTWGRVYVELRPMGPLSEREVSAMMDAIRPFDIGAGLTVYGGPT